MKWEIVMGLEVHAELATKSKIFCDCATAFGGEPNTQVCPVCAGMPGSLPKLNRAVVEYAMRAGLALGCEITRRCQFDRKNYFYPDLPKAYQVSQLYAPICTNGSLDIGGKSIRIREIHMEEDAGKLIHSEWGDETHMDFNRCGVPLIEIVSQPDFRSADEVIAYLERLREILLYLGVCDCKMQEGSLRADVNLSVRCPGEAFGVRTETKNLNSFKAIARAIAYEAARQMELLESGGQVIQETRRWDDSKGISYAMRSKENAQDYRYFPEPDLLPIEISDAWLSAARDSLPELAQAKRERYIRDYALPQQEALLITGHKNISDLFEAAAEQSRQPLEAAHLITGEIMRLMNQTGTLPEDLRVDAGKLACLISLVTDGKINRKAYKETAAEVFINDVAPEAYIAAHGLLISDDSDKIQAAAAMAIAQNPRAVLDYRAGIEKSFGFLMGQAMKALRGTGNPCIVKEALQAALEAL